MAADIKDPWQALKMAIDYCAEDFLVFNPEVESPKVRLLDRNVHAITSWRLEIQHLNLTCVKMKTFC